MGWSSGTDIFTRMAGSLNTMNIKGAKAVAVLGDLIESLEEGDCDTLDEAFGISDEADQALVNAGYGEEDEI